jgi:hypothetical protein
MSKYEELCSAFTSARKLFNQYETDCKNFAMEIWERLQLYYAVPISSISLHNIDPYGTADKIADFEELLMILREDSFFEFGIGITLFEVPKAFPYPHFTIVLPIDLAIDKDGIHKVRYGEDGKIFEIKNDNDEDYQKFFDEVFILLKAEYDEGLSNMRLHNTFRKIGYQINSDDK